MDYKLCFFLIGLLAMNHVLAEDAPASAEDSKEVSSVAPHAVSDEPGKADAKSNGTLDKDYQNDEAPPASAAAAVTTSTMPPLVHGSSKMNDETKPEPEPSPTTVASSPEAVTVTTASPKPSNATKTAGKPTEAPQKKSAGHKSGSDFLRGSFVLASLCLIFAKAVQ